MVSARAFIAKHRTFVSNYRLEFAALLVVITSIPGATLVAQDTNETPVRQHLQPGQPIDVRNLPAEVLNCDECRRRLGLPPLAKPIVESNDKKTKPETEAKKSEAVAKPSPKVEPQKDEEATAEPTLKQLGQHVDEPAAKSSTPDLLRVEGVLTSPATQRIEIEILKRQLQERDVHLKQFSDMQSNVEERIDQLVRMNEEFAKKDAGRQAELDRIQKSSEQALQARELELSNLRADLASVRADANEKAKRLNDELIELERRKATELVKLSTELIEAKQARIDAVASLRKEFADSKEAANGETQGMIAEQKKVLESQQATIRKLKEQLANAEKAQREDAERLDKIRKELIEATAEKTRALSELSKRIKIIEETNKSPKAEEAAKVQSTVKVMEPAKATTTAEQKAAMPDQNPAPLENEANKKRRAF